MRRPSALALVALIASACQSTSDQTLPPLTRLSVHHLEARGELTREGVTPARVELAPVQDERGLAERLREYKGVRPERNPKERIVVAMELVTLEPEAVERLTGWHDGDERAFTTPAWDAERVVRRAKQESDSVILATPRVALFLGEQGSLQVLDQRAYIENFVIEYGDGIAIADPVVDVFTDGMVMTFTGQPTDDGRISLNLELCLVELCEPIAEYETHLMSKDTPFSIQQPIAACQRLQLEAPCGEDECLVLVAQTLDGSGRLLLAFITVRSAQNGELPTAVVPRRMAG